MRIKMLKAGAGPNGSWSVGALRDVSEDEARELVEGGYAVPAEAPGLEAAVAPPAPEAAVPPSTQAPVSPPPEQPTPAAKAGRAPRRRGR